MSNLQRLTVELWAHPIHAQDPIVQPTKTALLPLLQNLELRGFHTWAAKTFLNYIETPALVRLVLENTVRDKYDRDEDWSNLEAKFLNVQKIRLANWQKPYEILRAVLHGVNPDEYPHLECLEISNYRSRIAFDNNRPFPFAMMPLPRLGTLEVHNVSLEEVCVLLDAYPNIHTLKVSLYRRPPGDPDSKEEFARLAASLIWFRQRVSRLSVGPFTTTADGLMTRHTHTILETVYGPEKRSLLYEARHLWCDPPYEDGQVPWL
ncbi:hypothetical protein FRB99_003654 [Tulasnella sp. 403]|nr:hypothetical protein FRB99_003654 [Tulasnella sp. 403]